jgi:hypothetical protein
MLKKVHGNECEDYWRKIISSEVKEAIDNGSEINAYGAYLLIKNG